MYIYVASSWRNLFQPTIVAALKKEGYDVYDFRNPKPGDTGFSWSEIDHDWQNWTPEQYQKALEHPLAKNGFNLDFEAMMKADTFVGVAPFGRSASFEMGWAAGQGKRTALLLAFDEPELMVKMFDAVVCTYKELRDTLAKWNNSQDTQNT